MLELVGKIDQARDGDDEYIRDMFLTADDASSLTIQGTTLGAEMFGMGDFWLGATQKKLRFSKPNFGMFVYFLLFRLGKFN